MNAPKEHRCPHCGTRHSWTGTGWLVADASGRTSAQGPLMGKSEPEPELRTCANCRRPLSIGTARVEEVAE